MGLTTQKGLPSSLYPYKYSDILQGAVDATSISCNCCWKSGRFVAFPQEQATIFAAANLRNALKDVGALFVEEGRAVARFSYASPMRRGFVVFQ